MKSDALCSCDTIASKSPAFALLFSQWVMRIQPVLSLVAPAVDCEVFLKPSFEFRTFRNGAGNDVTKASIARLGFEPHLTQDNRPVAPVGVLIFVKLPICFDAFDCDVVAQPLLNVGF
jgi:hypothetical protein